MIAAGFTSDDTVGIMMTLRFPCRCFSMTLCTLIITDLCHFCVFYQKSSKKLCTADCWSFLKTIKSYTKTNLDSEKKHSTYMALMILVDKITKSLENGEFVIGIFLDFSKAFDTVNHDILLQKLHHYGIRGTAFMWFKSYLSCRYQYVTYNSTESSKTLIKCGVPQGSILGPLLFLVYINDLANVCKTSMPLLFADDTNLFFLWKRPSYHRSSDK